MTTYVRKKGDRWHWCKNCTQYPKEENIEDSTSTRPSFDLCDQCLAKEKEENCKT